jgi:hypothetical protein
MYAKRQKAVLRYLKEHVRARPIEIGKAVYGPVPKAYRAASVCQGLLARGLIRRDNRGRYSLVDGVGKVRLKARPLPAIIDRSVTDVEDALMAFEKAFHLLAEAGAVDDGELQALTEASEKARRRLRHHVHGWIDGTLALFREHLGKLSDAVGSGTQCA